MGNSTPVCKSVPKVTEDFGIEQHTPVCLQESSKYKALVYEVR
jgi:hypothetical protein